ncbi:MAG: SRPBCC domain-containing protein [Flavobacteriaceae bacterium]|nr:SRPBCC domain-containing protein [Flavobacteriaceae bacterium]
MIEKKKLRMEFEVRGSAASLFPYISSPSGLAEWFCKDVNVRGEEFRFKWEGEERTAKVVKKTMNKNIKFHWIDSETEEYFELELEKDDITGDMALVVTDFAKPGEEKETEQLWESQIHDLMLSLGVS